MNEEKRLEELQMVTIEEADNPKYEPEEVPFIYWLKLITLQGKLPIEIVYRDTTLEGIYTKESKTVRCRLSTIDTGDFDPNEILPYIGITPIDESSIVEVCIYDIVSIKIL